MNSRKNEKVTLRIVKKEEPKKIIDWIELWGFIAIAGFLIFVLSMILSDTFITTISTFGLLMIISPAIIFQFNIFAGVSDLKLEWRDFLRVWFYAFNVIFLAVDSVLFTFFNSFLKFVPVKEGGAMTSAEYWHDSIYWIIGTYVSILVIAFAYRWFRKRIMLIP